MTKTTKDEKDGSRLVVRPGTMSRGKSLTPERSRTQEWRN